MLKARIGKLDESDGIQLFLWLPFQILAPFEPSGGEFGKPESFFLQKSDYFQSDFLNKRLSKSPISMLNHHSFDLKRP